MKYSGLVFLYLMLNGCAVVDSSNFDYLDDKNLELFPLLIIGVEKDVEISLPKNLAAELPDTIFMESEGLNLSYTKALSIPFEWQWGGPIQEDKVLYQFELSFLKFEGRQLLSENIDDKIQIVKKHYEDFEEGPWRERVLHRMIVEEYQSKQGYQWVVDNKPTVKKHHEQFTLSISDERELVVWFWYNEDWVKDHPEWYERRKALSRRILDSVKLSGTN